MRELKHFSSAQSVVPSTLFVVNDDCIIIIIYILIHLFRMCALIRFVHLFFIHTHVWIYEYDRYSYVHLSSKCQPHNVEESSAIDVSPFHLSITANSILNFIHHHAHGVHNKLLAATNIYDSFSYTFLFVLAIHFVSFRCSAHSIGGPFPSSFWRTDLFDTKRFRLAWLTGRCTAHSRLWFR